MFTLLCEDRNKVDANLPKLSNVASCWLYVVHGAFCTTAQSTRWILVGILRALWYLFNDWPYRREDYITLTVSSSFWLNFCDTWGVVHGWCNEAERKQQCRSSFSTIQNALQDHIAIPKLHMFMSIAKIL